MPQRSVLVTGGGGGIGRATSLDLAKHGYAVTVADHDSDAGRSTAAQIEAGGGAAAFVPVDVTEEADVAAMVQRAVASFGRLDAAVNVAGIVGPSGMVPLHEYSEAAWSQVIGVNLTGVWLCLKHEIAQMLTSGGGVIVNMASTAGLTGSIGRCAYSTSKHGLIGLTRCAAKEYGGRGIRVNAVCPGPTLTPLLEGALAADPELGDRLAAQTPANRIARPDEIAAMVRWLCGPEADFINGAAMPIDGGMTA